MTFGRDKRLLLGALALLAPLPLPLNAVLSWPVLALYLAAVALFLRRAWRDPGSWLPPWAMNVLGLAYLPVLYLDLVVWWGGQLVRPVIHLAMFTVVVKLYAMRHERDKWHVLGGCFFLFLAAMGTSVHPSVVLYLLAFVAITLVLLVRFSYFSVLARFGYRQGEVARAPIAGFVAACMAGMVLLAVPLFALLPRIRTPYLMVRGTGTGTIVGAAGFSDLITLDSIGAARGSRQVLLRLRYEPQPRPRREIRIKAATYELYDGRSWRTSGGVVPLSPDRSGTFRLGADAARQRVEIWLLPWNSTQLPLPVQAVSLQGPRLAVARDRGGAVSLFNRPTATFRYDVELADEPVFDGLPVPDAADPLAPTLDARGATPRVAALAAQVMGEGTPYHRAQRLERHLATAYRYSEQFVGRSGQLPLERFLFEERQGHCEFFATAMVMMLRSQGIPARFVTGFYGGEPNAFEGYYIVRQSNAHAWVEAWVPGAGWQVFDPTPSSGRPGSVQQGLGVLASQVWDYFLFRWDRYVLTFGVNDQLSLLFGARGVWLSFWRLFGRDRDGGMTAEGAVEALEEETTTAAAAAASGWQAWMPRAVGGLVLLALIVAALWLLRRARRRPSATETYRRLRRRLERSGVPVPESLAPLRLLGQTRERFPGAADPAGRLVHLYLRESFAGEPLSDEELRDAAESLRAASQVLKKAG